MGFTPQQVDAMSMWQFTAALEGFARHHDPESDKKLSAGERDDLWAWMNR
ncbi:hypothetical protein [Xanthobacter sp.]|nr:hypothetical protein [Xanthobacter sp.]